MEVVARRFDVVLVSLEADASARGGRPCVVISPDEMNRYLPTVIVAPLTSKPRAYPTRIPINFKFKNGQIALEQIRTVDKARLLKPLGRVSNKTREALVALLHEMFAD